MGEIKLKQMFSRNPNLTDCVNRNTSHPLIRESSIIPFIA